MKDKKAQLHSLISIGILFIAVLIFAVIGYITYSIVQDVSKKARSKMEKKHVLFTKEGMKVGVKELNEEDYVDQSRSILVNMWNHTSFPAYKSRFWNMTGTTGAEKRKPHASS